MGIMGPLLGLTERGWRGMFSSELLMEGSSLVTLLLLSVSHSPSS
jgi:hypothetical protein